MSRKKSDHKSRQETCEGEIILWGVDVGCSYPENSEYLTN